MLLSGVLLPISLAPAWLQDVADFNPLLYAVEAAASAVRCNISRRLTSSDR